MDLDLSVTTPQGVRDVAVSAPAGAPLPDVAAALADAVGLDGALYVEGRPLSAGRFDGGVLLRGAVVASTPPEGEPAPAGVLSLQVIAGPGAGRSIALGRGRLTLGRDAACDVVIADPDVSRRHAEIAVGTRITVRDLGSTNGTTLDGVAVGSEPVLLRRGARLRVGDCLVTVTAAAESPATTRPGPDGTRRVLRPPRCPDPPARGEVVFPEREQAAPPGRVQWLSGLVPAAAGVGLAWWAGSPQFLLFALLSPVMLLSTAAGDRLHWRRSRRRGAADYRRAVTDSERQVAAGLAAESRARWAASPDPAAVFRTATLPGRRLWMRRPGDPDGLHVRLGVGEQPTHLLARRGTRTEPAGSLAAVPVEIDLRRGPLGLAGPVGTVDAVARWAVTQLAVHHSPGEVELAFLLDPQRAPAWSWARWLPHVERRAATSPEEWATLLASCAALVAARRRGRGTAAEPWTGGWLVLVVDRAAEFAELPALAALLADGSPVGVTAICVETEAGRWPGGCHAMARIRGETGTRLAVRSAPDAAELEAIADQVSPEWAERVARELAPCVDDSAAAANLPAGVGLLAALGLPAPDADAVAASWAASAGGARAVLGVGPEGPVTVDLALDGPHALVAGTTGAGKSELLQALVASLAANHPPEDMTVLLIDYKGGAAFAECAGLPHAVGLVTDLDPYLTERALRSLDAELRRRERLLAAAGASDLDGYRATAPAEPLPRLVIVVDEFATLAAELPDFVRGLVSVAQRGRSLGVHLVLATQRPGSAVSPEIRANTALRCCLRVTDPAESSDVLGSAEAAAIDASTPGRAYLRAGSALTPFQSAFPSGRTPDAATITVEPLGPWRRRGPAAAAGAGSDLARLVAAIAAAARASDRPPARRPWTPPLPDELPQSELGRPARPTSVRIARVDRPDEQRCDVLELDLGAGESLLLAGAARSGRTSALAAVALGAAGQLPPGELALHLIDPAGGLSQVLAPLPHLATALGTGALDLVPRLLTLLERVCARAEPAGTATGLLLVDGWERLQAALPDTDAAVAGELLAHLLRVAPAAGLGVVVAGDRSTLTPRFSSGFGRRILLRQADRTDFGLVGIPARAVPPRLVPGRGLLADDGALLHLAHPGTSPEAVRGTAERVAATWAGAGAAPALLRALPERVRLADVPADPDGAGHGLVIGLGGDRSERLCLDPFAGAARLVVAGPPRSGRTTLLRSLARQAAAAGTRTVVAAPPRSGLAETAAELALPVFTPDSADPGPPPGERTLLLLDDCEAFTDHPAGDRLTEWLLSSQAPVAAVVAGRSDDLSTSYRGPGAAARRSHCGLLLRPGPVDGELLGVRLPRRPASGPPGRGVIVGDPAWGPLFAAGEPVPVQVAAP